MFLGNLSNQAKSYGVVGHIAEKHSPAGQQHPHDHHAEEHSHSKHSKKSESKTESHDHHCELASLTVHMSTFPTQDISAGLKATIVMSEIYHPTYELIIYSFTSSIFRPPIA